MQNQHNPSTELCSRRLMSVLVFQYMLVKSTVKTNSLETHSFKVLFTNKYVCQVLQFIMFLIAQEMFTDTRISWVVDGKHTGERNAFIPVAV